MSMEIGIDLVSDSSQIEQSAKAVEQLSNKLTAAERAVERHAIKMKILRGELEDLGKGFTASQAYQLASIKVMGATESQMKALATSFQQFNAIAGVNPFDKVTDGVSKLRNEIAQFENAQKAMAFGFNLTKQQAMELGRDMNSLTQKLQQQGASYDSIQKEIEDLILDYVGLAQQKNDLVAASERIEKQAKEEARAHLELARAAEIAAQQQQQSSDNLFKERMKQFDIERREMEQRSRLNRELYGADDRSFIAEQRKQETAAARQAAVAERELQKQIAAMGPTRKMYEDAQKRAAIATNELIAAERRLEAQLDETNSEFMERNIDILNKYQQNLRQAGVGATEAAQRFAKFRQGMEQLNLRQSADDVRMLSRAMSVQLGDVGISLASGMNPLLVLLQQGDQIRGIVQQMDADSRKLNQAMSGAFKDIAVSAGQTASAIGMFLVNAVVDTGKAMANFAAQGTMAAAAALVDLADGGNRSSKAFENLSLALTGLATPAMIAATFALVGLLYQYYQFLRTSREIVNALNLQGASFGISKQQALDMASAISDAEAAVSEFGYTSNTARTAMAELLKVQGLGAENLKQFTINAIELNRNVGISYADTAKQIEAVIKDPVDELLKLAVNTGQVRLEVIGMIDDLRRNGENADAVTLALQELNRAQLQIAQTVREDLEPVQRFWMDFKNAISDGTSEILNSVAELGAELIIGSGKIVNFVVGSTRISRAAMFGTTAEMKQALADMKSISQGLDDLLKKDRTAELDKQVDAQRRKTESDNARALQGIRKFIQDAEGTRIRESAVGANREDYIRERANQIISRFKVESIEAVKELGRAMQAAEAQAAREWEQANQRSKEAGPKVDPQVKEYERTLERVLTLIDNTRAKQEELNKSEALLAEIRRENKLSPDQMKRVELLLTENAALEDTIKAEKELKRLREIEFDAGVKVAQDIYKAYNEITLQQIKATEELADQSVELDFQASLIGKSAEDQRVLTLERQKSVALLKIERDLQREIEKIRADLRLDDNKRNAAIKKQEEIAANSRANVEKEFNNQVRRHAQQEYEKLYKSVEDGLTNAFMRAFENGGSFAEAFRQEIQRLLNDMVIRPIVQAVLSPVTSAVSNTLGGMLGIGGTAAGTKGTISTTLALKNLTNTVKTAFSTGGSITPGLNLALQRTADWMMTSTNSIIARLGDTLNGSVGQLSKVLGTAGNVMAGWSLNRMISGEFRTNRLVDLASVVGSAIFGPIAGAIGGLINRAFGRGPVNTTGQGITGTLSVSGGANLVQYQDWHQRGGWFRSSRSGRNISALDSGVDAFLDSSIAMVAAATREYGAVIGLSADRINNVAQQVTVSLMGLSSQQQQQAIKTMLENFSELIAGSMLAGFEYLIKEGEKASAALVRLVENFTKVNDILRLVNVGLLQTSISGADAASQLVDLFGGLDKFTSLTNSYYQNFFTEEERRLKTLQGLQEAFAAMGMSLPNTREAYRALVESQNLMTVEGRNTFRVLMELSGAFAEVQEGATRTVQAFTSMIDKILAEIYGQSPSVSTQRGTDARAFLSQQAGIARAGGQLASGTSIEAALSVALNGLDANQFASLSDFERIRLILASDLEAIRAAGLSNIPAFASGGTYRGGLALVGEQGPELINFNQGGTVHTAAETASIFSSASNAELASELRALREEVIMLRAETRATAISSTKTTRILERVTRDGESLIVTQEP